MGVKLVIVRAGGGEASTTASRLVPLPSAALSCAHSRHQHQVPRHRTRDAIVLMTNLLWVLLSHHRAVGGKWPQPMTWLWVAWPDCSAPARPHVLTRALQRGDVSMLTPISYLQLPVVALGRLGAARRNVDRYTVPAPPASSPATSHIAQREADWRGSGRWRPLLNSGNGGTTSRRFAGLPPLLPCSRCDSRACLLPA